MKIRTASWGFVTVTLAALGAVGSGRISADPATVSTAVTPPARPATADEQALGAHINVLQTQLGAAVTAGRYHDYETAMKQLATPYCRFFTITGKSTSRTQFLTGEARTFAGAGPAPAESVKTLTLTITGSTALQTGVATDDADVVDTTGQYGTKGRSHHWQRMTFFRVHWAAPTAATSLSGIQASAWKAEEFAFTDIQTFLDGSPYQPSQPAVKAPRESTRRRTTPKSTTRRPRVRRYPYVISGGQYYSF